MAGSQKIWTKEEVTRLLKSSDYSVKRALLALYSLQTTDEQTSLNTFHSNSRGFNAFDAPGFSSYAKTILQGYDLCESTIKKIRPRILKYVGQLITFVNNGEKLPLSYKRHLRRICPYKNRREDIYCV